MRSYLLKITLAVMCQGLSFFIFPLSSAAAEDVIVSRLQVSDGLADNCINDILCDTRGNMWIGTNGGLDYFDGNNVWTVDFPSDNAVYVYSLAEDINGLVWAGTSDGLYSCSLITANVRRFNIGSVSSSSVSASKVRQIKVTDSGYLWVVDDKEGVLVIDTRTNRITRTELSSGKIVYDGGEKVFVMAPNFSMLMYSEDGTCLHTVSDLSHVSANRINAAFGKVIVSPMSGESYLLDTSGGRMAPSSGLHSVKYVIMLGSGLACVGSRNEIYLIDSTFTKTKSLMETGENTVRCLCEDNSGGIWVGTQFDGAYRIEKNGILLEKYRTVENKSFKAREFVEDQKGNIWIGSDTKGLLCLDARTKSLRPFRSSYSGRNILGLMSEGRYIWVGAIDNNAVCSKIDIETAEVIRYPEAGGQVYSFCRDLQGRLWIGGLNGFKVGKDYPDGRFVKEMDIPSSQVCRIACTKDGVIWVATISGSVWKYVKGELTSYSVRTTNYLTDLFVSKDDRIFLSSEGNGLFEYDQNSDSFTSCKTEEKRVLRVSEDKRGHYLWISSPRSLYAINKNDLSTALSISFSKLNMGMLNYSSNYMSSNGVLYLGTSEGFICFAPDSLCTNGTSASSTSITNMRLLSDKTDFHTFSRGGDQVFQFDADVVSMEVGVSSHDYSFFPTDRLYWRIKEKNQGWTLVKNGIVPINGLLPGEWTLQLKNQPPGPLDGSVVDTVITIKDPSELSPLSITLIIAGLLSVIILSAYITFRKTRKHIKKQLAYKDYETRINFLTSLAHEIRTPLSLILLPLDSLLQKFSESKDKEALEHLDVMKRNSMKLIILINELLDFQKLNAANFSVHSEMIDVRQVVKDAHRRFASSFVMENKILRMDVPDEPVYCEADVRILDRILDNVFSNALKYSSKYLNVSLKSKGGDAVFEFENDGELVPLNQRKSIFEAFSRYEEGKNAKVEGTGLGLSTSKSFAELLGGKLQMDKDEAVNRFILELPLAVRKVQPISSEIKDQMFDKTLMVVEDDSDMAKVISGYFKDSFNILLASNGKEAYEMIEQGANPTIVISDVMMPEMDGIEFTRKLKGNLSTSHIPIILLSAQISEKALLDGLDQGADAYIEKPFSPQVLVKRVDNLLQIRRKLADFFASNPLDVNIPSSNISNSEQKFLRSIQEYVSSNISHEISIDELAASVNMSNSALSKKMKAYTGVSPLEYITSVRLRRATELLQDDRLSVADVCFAVGFNTHSFFTSCFKKKYGMTPKQWRDNYNNK